MRIKGKICLDYADQKSAQLVYDSLEIDNKNYVDSKIDDNKIIYQDQS